MLHMMICNNKFTTNVATNFGDIGEYSLTELSIPLKMFRNHSLLCKMWLVPFHLTKYG